MPGKDAPTAAQPAPKLTEADLARYVELDRRRKELDRESRTLSRELGAIEAKARAYLKSVSRDEAKRGRFKAFVDLVKSRVAWKQAFVGRLGSEAAAELEREAPMAERLRIVAVEG